MFSDDFELGAVTDNGKFITAEKKFAFKTDPKDLTDKPNIYSEKPIIQLYTYK